MSNTDLIFLVQPKGALSGAIRVPGDKSISHRAIILSALAEGKSHFTGFLEGADSLATLAAMRQLGVNIQQIAPHEIIVEGVGLQGLQATNQALDLANSGTAMRLMAGLLVGQNFSSTLTGDESLSERPMARILEPLQLMGAQITAREKNLAPLVIEPVAQLRAIDYQIPMASAQVKSCILLAALYAHGETIIYESGITRDHTERMLKGMGYNLRQDSNLISLVGGGQLQAIDMDIPADISSAAFFMVAATITPGSEIFLAHVGINPTRTGCIQILRQMGADIRIIDERVIAGEPVADIMIKYAPLTAIDIAIEQVSLAIDEFPVLFIAAANARGVTRLRQAAELRVKESDRIAAMAAGLAILGVKHQVYADGIDIEGGSYHGGEIDSLGDHRIAMAFTIAALRAQSPIVIHNCANVATSFPNFVALANQLGLSIVVKEHNGKQICQQSTSNYD